MLDGPLAVAFQRLVAQQPIALDVPRQFDQVYRQEPFNSALWCNLAEDGTAAGDCEDYAIAKFVALQEAGVSIDDLRILILQDDIQEEDHTVVAARLDGKWLMLDNRRMVMLEDQQVPDYYHPVFLIDLHGVKRYSGASPTSEKSRGYERTIGQILY